MQNLRGMKFFFSIFLNNFYLKEAVCFSVSGKLYPTSQGGVTCQTGRGKGWGTPGTMSSVRSSDTGCVVTGDTGTSHPPPVASVARQLYQSVSANSAGYWKYFRTDRNFICLQKHKLHLVYTNCQLE